MHGWLRQSTASQEIKLGPFVNSTDGNTQEIALTIANTDIKLTKGGSTTETNKNSGGATHVANGRYTVTLDATDTNTLGILEVDCHPTGALPSHRSYMVLPADVYDALVAGTGNLSVLLAAGAITNASLAGNMEVVFETDFATNYNTTRNAWATNVQDSVGTGQLNANITQISGDTTAADNLEADYDGTGYNKTNSTIGTCTANTDMRGTDGANTTTPNTVTPLDAAGVRSAVGLAAADLDTQLSAKASQTSVDTIDTNVDTMVLGIITGSAQTGTLSTTQASTNLSGYADDQLIGRVVTWTSGACEGESTDITDYANTNGVLTFTALTTAPSNGDTFKIT